MKNLSRLTAILAAIVLLASILPVGALALSGSDPLLYANLSRADFSFDYIPVANSEYALYLFSADGGEVQARAQLMENGETIAEGEGFGEILSAWLVAGTKYTVRVHGSGNAVIELARSTMSRCYNQALEVAENASQGKMIAREFDAHWYSFRAEDSTLLMLTAVPEDRNLALNAWLFDDTGALVSAFDTLPGGACMLLAETQSGRNYFLRVCAPDGGTGYYSLNLNRSDGPDFAGALRFSQQEYTLAAGDMLNLAEFISGEPLLWVSDNPAVAAAAQDGSILGFAPGEARVTAYGLSSQAVCTVIVEHVPLEGVEIPETEITLAAGDKLAPEIRLIPENASERRLRYIIADRSVASVNSDGVLTGVSPGETTLTVRSSSGSAGASVRVIVTPAEKKYRALLIGEQNYPFAENTERKGSENSVQAIASLLDTVDFDGAKFETRTAADLSKAELIAKIRETFSGASEQDVSLLYINSHGSYEGGMSFLELSDGSTLSARDLERELRGIPGAIVVMIDCCGSGGAIGKASDRADFAKGITGAFSGAAIRGSKFKVLASAGLDEDSFRIAFNENAASGVMATVFARSLCDGAGWSIDRGARKSMGADINYDGSITLDELYLYMSARVNWYLGIASELTGEDYRQSVQVYPEGDPFILFER
ncbi:MAG: Ig-like domain-containing protein [Clostridia bacterium]|nr:Ig-like domain-containing protein [Clostridia bacterium]